MARPQDISIRSVGLQDRPLIDRLIASADWCHAHLDWLGAGDLTGLWPFLLATARGRPAACLACPPDPPGVAWIRVFAGLSHFPADQAWQALWPQARGLAVEQHAEIAAALAADPWMVTLLQRSGFAESNRVVFLEWQGKARAPVVPLGTRLRPYQPSDLDAVYEVDRQAFGGLWAYSRPVLSAALSQAASVTIMEAGGVVAGYQLSTASALGAHLARLAVQPGFQRRGYGRALVEHLLHEFGTRGFDRVSVNTQQDNAPSLGLYHRLGFRDTRQAYPVLTRPIAVSGSRSQQGGGS